MSRINDPSGGYRLGGYREVALPPALRRVAEVGWTFAPAANDLRPGARGHRVIPETGVSLCLLSPGRAGSRPLEPALALMGPIRAVRFFAPDPDGQMAGIRLKPEWCRALLGVDPADHADAIDPLPAAASRRLGSDIRGRLAGASSPAEAVGLLAAELARIADGMPAARPLRLAHAALESVRRAPAVPLDLPARARELGVSERHLRRVVRESTGRGPKYFHRVRRLQAAVSGAGAAASVAWSRLAVCGGYYDQAHMIGEFRALAGATPSRLRAERSRPASDFSNTPRP